MYVLKNDFCFEIIFTYIQFRVIFKNNFSFSMTEKSVGPY